MRQPSLLQRTYDRYRLNWMPSANVGAQAAHLCAAAMIVFFFPACLNASVWYGTVTALAFAVVKEFVIDPLLEGDSLSDGLLDASFYAIGTATALGLYFATMGLRS
jgi:hypothetical protein